MKKRMPESDWELMEADSDVVEPKRKPKQESEAKDYECERPEKQ